MQTRSIAGSVRKVWLSLAFSAQRSLPVAVQQATQELWSSSSTAIADNYSSCCSLSLRNSDGHRLQGAGGAGWAQHRQQLAVRRHSTGSSSQAKPASLDSLAQANALTGKWLDASWSTGTGPPVRSGSVQFVGYCQAFFILMKHAHSVYKVQIDSCQRLLVKECTHRSEIEMHGAW